MEPRPWSICLSGSDVNLFISHGDIPPTIQTPTSSLTMESAFSLEHFSTIAADLTYVLLLGQPLPELLCTAWHISSKPAPSVPLVLGQHVLLVSPASRTYFGHLKSIVRVEDSYLVISVSPESSAYSPFIPESCHIHLPLSFISLPWTHQIRYSCFTSQQTQMKQCSRTLLRSPYRVQNLPLTAQGKTALREHQSLHFCPTKAQPKGFVTLCDQL